jgi:hypothetical protein
VGRCSARPVDRCAQLGQEGRDRLGDALGRRDERLDPPTIALPTITASATSATRAAVSASLMPKPTPTGRSTADRMRARCSATSAVSRFAAPVTPLTET